MKKLQGNINTKNVKTAVVSTITSLALAGTCAVATVATTPANAVEQAELESSATETVNMMYRLYNPYTGEHFYTSNQTEQKSLVKQGWKDEGIGWYAPVKSNTPVYRLYNKYAPGGDHHYTMSTTERDNLVEQGWTYESVGWYSDDEKGTELYRQYNPYASVGTHNYTTSSDENDKLVKAGWKEEGTAWYGVKKSDDVQVVNHTHNWEPVYKTVHHDAVTHEETEQIIAGYTGEYRCKRHNVKLIDDERHCPKCAEEQKAAGTYDIYEGTPSNTYLADVPYYKTVTKTVIDKAAYDEQVIDHYSCTCGATK